MKLAIALHIGYVIARFSKADTILRSRYTQDMRSPDKIHILSAPIV